jgi:NAD(P)H-flavin reductase
VTALDARVLSNRRATPTTRSLFVDLRGRAFTFKPGQWASLGVDAASARPYSIASSPFESRDGILEFLIRDDGTGTDLSRLRRGATLFVDGPHGRFCLPDEFSAPHILFVAGGTGIAPLRAMLHHTLDQPSHPPCTLIYSARNAQEFAYLKELRAEARAGRIRLALAVTRDAHARWKGHSTRVNRAILGGLIASTDTQAFVCGPAGFVTDMREALEALGVRKIRSEEQ